MHADRESSHWLQNASTRFTPIGVGPGAETMRGRKGEGSEGTTYDFFLVRILTKPR
jgi:hypothetical protein